MNATMAQMTYVTAYSTETGATATMVSEKPRLRAEASLDRALAAGGNVWDTRDGLLPDDQAEIVACQGYEIASVVVGRYPETMRLLGVAC